MKQYFVNIQKYGRKYSKKNIRHYKKQFDFCSRPFK